MNKKEMALLATAELTESQISRLTESQIRCLTGSQISCLTESQISRLTGLQIRWLTRSQISWLTESQISRLTESQIRCLTGSQISCLSESQIRCLTRSQISWLTESQIRCLTESQIRCLSESQEVPIVPNLYSRMLADIREEKRILDQSTFGPGTITEKSLCNAPMCIAGHTVNIAGPAGYKLAKSIGFAGAALLIHRASLPKVGAPRYDNYPSEWALAYVEERAAEGN